MFLTLFIITSICFMLIRILPRELPQDKNLQAVIQARWDALGYGKPLLVQYGIYLKNIITDWDFGTSWYVSFRSPAWDVLMDRLLPTVLVNFYSFLFSIPVGIALGIFAERLQKFTDCPLCSLFVHQSTSAFPIKSKMNRRPLSCPLHLMFFL